MKRVTKWPPPSLGPLLGLSLFVSRFSPRYKSPIHWIRRGKWSKSRGQESVLYFYPFYDTRGSWELSIKDFYHPKDPWLSLGHLVLVRFGYRSLNGLGKVGRRIGRGFCRVREEGWRGWRHGKGEDKREKRTTDVRSESQNEQEVGQKWDVGLSVKIVRLYCGSDDRFRRSLKRNRNFISDLRIGQTGVPSRTRRGVVGNEKEKTSR